jgi:hydrogenase expression/formation protein HypE
MKRITLADGAGGEKMAKLIKQYVLKHLNSSAKNIDVGLSDLDDSAVVNDVVFTTDSHTVKPLFFPGGDIGSLAVAGTVNDIAVMGVNPIALSSAFVIEEGFSIDDYEKILLSMKKTSKYADVPIVTGDTKVVEKGGVERIIINTSGIGMRSKLLDENIKEVKRYRRFDEKWIKDSNIEEGDKIIVSGSVGDHGIAILSFREGYGYESEIKSDVKPLNKMIEKILNVGGVVSMKDPTRGGLANTLNEFAEKSKMGIMVDEEKIPIKEGVKSACEMLGIDPLEIGNEGKIVIGAVKEKAGDILKVLRKTKEGKDAEIIGEATKKIKGVVLKTVVGGRRIVETPVGDPVPRIC